MKKILILTASNPASNPRPRRMIENLRGIYELYAMGIGSQEIEGVKTFSFPSYQKRNFFQELRLYYHCLTSQYQKLIWTDNRLKIVPFLEKYDFDYIICFDLPLLPIAFKYKKNAKIIFDAQEYFPQWITSSLRWRILFQHFNHYLCKTYLPKCHCVLSVSPSFVHRYAKEYHIQPKLYLSLPYFYDLPPKPCNPLDIKILYHGSLSSNRSIDEVVSLIDDLPKFFSLNLVLVGGEAKYRKKIETMIEAKQKEGKKIFLLPPVKFEEIIPFGRDFDIGLYFMPPKTYNLLSTIPNKFFEYIGSSLAVMSTPNTDLIPLILQYKIGKISKDFSLNSMLALLSSLTLEEINAYKRASYEASKELNNAKNKKIILGLLESI